MQKGEAEVQSGNTHTVNVDKAGGGAPSLGSDKMCLCLYSYGGIREQPRVPPTLEMGSFTDLEPIR